MNRNKKTKNVKQNKAIDNIVEKTMDMNAKRADGSMGKNK